MRIFFGLCFSLLMALPAVAQTQTRSSGTFFTTPSVSAPPAAGDTWLIAWTGLNITNGYTGGYVGAIAPLNGNLNLEGVAFRGDFAYGRYDYNYYNFGTASSVDTSVPTNQGDLMVGYRKKFGETWLGAYVGAAYESHRNPDPAAAIQGTQAGVKAIVDYWGPINDKFILSGVASFASPFSTYYGQGRLGYKVADKVSLGPEASLFGNTAYREGRLGAFARFETRIGDIYLSGGYLHPLTSGSSDGYYANVHLGIALQHGR